MDKTTILIVEDEAIIAADLADRLGMLGHEVVGTADTGKEAIELACRLLPRVVLMDIRLKGEMDGIQAAEVIRSQVDLPILFLTAHSDTATLDRAKFSNPYGYILKPYEERDLATTIEMALHKHQSDKQLREQRDALRASETRYRSLFENMLDGLAYCRMLFDERGHPADFVYLEVNSAFARLTGLENVTGKRVTEAIPGIQETNQELIETYGRVALTGRAERFEIYVEPLGMWFSISAYSPEREHFVAVFDNITERKRAEEMLRESMRREQERAAELATLLDAVPTPVFIAHDTECLNITGNRAADELLHIPRGAEASLSAPTEVRPRHFRALKDGRELRLDELPAQRAARGTHVEDFEFSIAFDDGTTRHVLGYGTPLRDEEGRPRGAIHVLVDITERKRAESALRDSERLYRAIGESIDYGVWVCAPDGRCTYASESFLRIVGMTQEQCSNFGWGNVLHPDDAENTISAWKECVRIEGVWDIEHRFRGTDGQWHPILARGVPVRNDSGEVIFWAGINLDISRMKRTEDELRASEEKFSTMLQTVPIAIALATLPDGALYNVNPAWLDLTEIASKEDAIGKTSLELGLIADAVQRQSILNEFRQSGFVRNVEQTFRTRKGVQRTVLVNLDRVEIGGSAFILSTMEEITERKQAEEELLQKHRKLESMSIELSLAEERERDRIAGELHDQVGQRLIFGKMKLGALASQVQTDTCLNDVEELERIIDLSIEDIRTLTFQLRPPLLASAGLEAALHWLGEEFREQYGLLLSYFDDGQQKPMRYEARSTVFQAAREMLLNTVKHADATQIGITIRRDADLLQVCVSDNGRGFDLAEAGKKKSKSGGFGLINVQRRIEHLGGSIIIASRPGNGTCVTIMAPLDISH